MGVIFRFLKRAILAIIGLAVALTALAFIIIAPPPYPYFDWEPYFDQAYAEDGCEGAAAFSSAAGIGEFRAPREQYAQMVMDGVCEQPEFSEFFPEYFLENEFSQPHLDGSIDEHTRHYFHLFSVNFFQGLRAITAHSIPILDPSRREISIGLIAYRIRCPYLGAHGKSSYYFRSLMISQWEAEELRMPKWERRWQECGDRILRLAIHWEQSENMPPSDRQGAELISWLDFELDYAFKEYDTNELWDLRFRWSLDQYATSHSTALWGRCPANWDEYGVAYQAELITQSHRTIAWLTERYLSNRTGKGFSYLADLRERGHLLPRSDEWAYFWYRIALDNGEEITESLARVSGRLSSDQRQHLEELLHEGRLPKERSEFLTIYLQQWAYYHYRSLGSLDPDSETAETLSLTLTEVELNHAQQQAALGQAPTLPDWQLEPNLFFDISWIDCETGEPIDR